MADFLLELRSEEIPARMQAAARNDLARMFAEGAQQAGLATGAIDVFSTPRRLALIARDVADATEARREELKGPRTSAPPQALEGFLRKTGLTQDQLEERDGVYFAVVEKPGRAAAEILGEIVARTIPDFPWPKSMRWGDGTLRWVRPLHGIVAMLGEEIVPIEVEGVTSGATTVGHRFHHPGAITLGGASDYAEKLRACHVIVDHEERERIIREGAGGAASKRGLALLEDEGLVVENAGLTEWPVPLIGEFDADFLEVPREVIVLTMRTNQKYFACTASDGGLAPAFVCVANVEANDGGAAIVEGNKRVLAARLSDARFFWEQDQKYRLSDFSNRLDAVRFFEGLGTYAEKQYRIMFLIQYLSDYSNKDFSSALYSVAEVSKADLATSTVSEFPELQGIIGANLAARDDLYADAAPVLKGLYKTSLEIMSSPADSGTNLLQLTDRIDNIVAFAAIGTWFKGSRDPFAIKQSAQAAIAAILKSKLRVPLRKAIQQTYDALLSGFFMNRNVYAVDRLRSRTGDEREVEIAVGGAGIPDKNYRKPSEFRDMGFRAKPATSDQLYANGFVDSAVAKITTYYTDTIDYLKPYNEISETVLNLFIDRLKVQQRDAGVRHDLIDAVFALGDEDDLVRLLARVAALQELMTGGEGTNLLAAYKRAANIVKKEEGSWTPDQVRGDGEVPPEQQALAAALDAAGPSATAAVLAEDFTGAMRALASLRRPIDAFFDKVTVNADDAGTRAERLNLLARFRDAVDQVADFSKIEG